MWHFPILSKSGVEGIRICESNGIDHALIDGNLPEFVEMMGDLEWEPGVMTA